MLGVFIYVRFLDNSRIIKLIASFCFALLIGFALNVTLSFKKCPECYGTDFCRYFQNRQVKLTWFSYLLSLVNPKYTKSVFYGVVNDSVPIAIKNKAGRMNKFDFKSIKDLELNSEKVQNVILCPGFNNLDFLFNQVNDTIRNEHLWLDIENSIEPLLLLYFQSYNWPTPAIYGTCGEFIIEEHKGESLETYLSSSFEKRAYLSLNLLKMADLFTFEHPDFIFYFTDYSLYNFVVDKRGKVSMIDLDNVILFNKSAKDVSIKNDIHVSESLHENEYIFSATDICSHYLSDHNFYSVCKFMLLHPEYGLLRQIPEQIQKYNKMLLELLNECAIPRTTNNRIHAGEKLQTLLEEIIKDYKWK